MNRRSGVSAERRSSWQQPASGALPRRRYEESSWRMKNGPANRGEGLAGGNRRIKLADNRRVNARYLRDEFWMASTARIATGSPATALAATSFSTASLAFTTAVYWSRVKFGAAWTDLSATNASRYPFVFNADTARPTVCWI